MPVQSSFCIASTLEARCGWCSIITSRNILSIGGNFNVIKGINLISPFLSARVKCSPCVHQDSSTKATESTVICKAPFLFFVFFSFLSHSTKYFLFVLNLTLVKQKVFILMTMIKYKPCSV